MGRVRFPGTTSGKKVQGTDLRPLPGQAEERATAEFVDSEKFRLVTTLCYDCRYCSPLMCGYMAARDINTGLAAVGAKAVACHLSGTLSYKIVECGKHRKGPLPPMGQVWPD